MDLPGHAARSAGQAGVAGLAAVDLGLVVATAGLLELLGEAAKRATAVAALQDRHAVASAASTGRSDYNPSNCSDYSDSAAAGSRTLQRSAAQHARSRTEKAALAGALAADLRRAGGGLYWASARARLRRHHAPTTSRERAGVNVASLYEYFPGKDAIVAQVAERLVQRVLARLARGARSACWPAGEARRGAPLDRADPRDRGAREGSSSPSSSTRCPYTNQLDADPAIGARLARVLAAACAGTPAASCAPTSPTPPCTCSINLVTSTIMQCVLDPPQRRLAPRAARRAGPRAWRSGSAARRSTGARRARRASSRPGSTRRPARPPPP